jgi:lysophospholipase L1-like esterase
LFATIPVFTLILILEFSLFPFAKSLKYTTIFVRDSELGWKLRSNSEDLWGGVIVKINSKGLRGPELDYAKRNSVKRILHLGDSVTFGYKLKSYELTFPYLIEGIIEDELEYEIETINAGVAGYSPWQEYIYFSTEGIKYEPDLVVLPFVMNDVTEKFGLIRFGGKGEGEQLRMTASRIIDKFFRRSNIIYFAKKITARIRFGSNIQQGAQQEETLNIYALAHHPDRQDVKEAWKITLQNLGKIFDFAKDRDIPVILVVFPVTFQFDDVKNLSTPQKILSKYAFDNKVQTVDLLQILYEKMEKEGTKPEDYFLDRGHLSTAGSEVTARILADFIQQEGLLTNKRAKHR